MAIAMTSSLESDAILKVSQVVSGGVYGKLSIADHSQMQGVHVVRTPFLDTHTY
jgi:hypothetical protein